MRVVRVYHAGRDSSHRERDRALVRAGIDVTLIVPTAWDENGTSRAVEPETFEVVELPVKRSGDVNRHRYLDADAVLAVVDRIHPDVVDLHEEPFSSVVHQLLRTIARNQPVVTYTAQNLDKRWPPPFAQYERSALTRIDGIYPCSRQAASVVTGKGFRGKVRVLPLGLPPSISAGDQQPPLDEVRMLLAGRLVPEKGVLDAVRTLAAVHRRIAATLTVVGSGPEAPNARRLAEQLGVGERLDVVPWLSASDLSRFYRDAHVVLVPSVSTSTWVEQFGRVVTEAQASGAVVVAYASGSLPEVIGAAGVLVAEGAQEALANAVVDLSERPDEWSRLRELGLGGSQAFSWDAVAAGQADLYSAVREQRPVRRRVHPRRAAAVGRFGAPAELAGGPRPFALPVLRRSNPATRAFGAAIDALSREPAKEDELHPQVVYLDHVAELSGGEVALVRLLEALPDLDAHVILAEEGPLRPLLEAAGATVEVLPLAARVRRLTRNQTVRPLNAARGAVEIGGYVLRLARRLRALDPEVVHTNSLKSGFYGSVAARIAGVPVIWHLRDRISPDYMPAASVRLTRAVLHWLPTTVIANSHSTLGTAGEKPGRRPVPALVLHDPYRPSRAPEGEQSGPLVVGMVGRLAEWKGQHIFLEAFAQAFPTGPVTALVIGSALFDDDESYAMGLPNRAKQLGIEDRVTFAGFRADVEAELAALSVLVHASTIPEPFGQVIVEGMAAGVAVIATDAGGPSEIISHGVNGWLVPPGDVDALADALRHIGDDAALRSTLGHAAQARARDFDPDRIGRQMAQIYAEVVRARSVRPRRTAER